MSEHSKHYIPAAGHDWALPFYDSMARVFGVDATRALLIDRAGLRPGHRVLDLGCGTGTLVTRIKTQHPDVDVTGIDPDPKVLARARRKLERAGVAARLDQGFAGALPYADARFDRAFSSLMFHHLEGDAQARALREIRRVLAPGGALHLLDFVSADHGARGLVARALHGVPRLREHTAERLLRFMREAGFSDPRLVDRRASLFGELAFFEATAPALAA